LRAYWEKALGRIGRLVFTLDRALWDDGARTLVVVYVGERDAERTRCVEIMRFGPTGHVVEGEAMYGVAV
jgi:hypothetical protein